MTDKPDYRKCNPKIAVGIVDGKPDPLGVEFPIYNEDGSSNGIQLPTGEQLFEMSKVIFAAMPNKDIRMIYHLLSEMTETVEAMLQRTIAHHHHFIHTSTPEGFDEDTLCSGLRQFLENVHQAPEDVVTPENSEKYVLDTFFTGNLKPN